jgi:hypothetical protein
MIPYHTSILTGQGWVLELINGHPECMHTELGVRVHVFHSLVVALQKAGMGSSKHLFGGEIGYIFVCPDGMTVYPASWERFQWSNETISK